MNFGCCDLKLRSRVIPQSQLQGAINPQATLQETSTAIKNQGINLLNQNKFNAANKMFLKMFDCKTLKANDFAEVGMILTNPVPGEKLPSYLNFHPDYSAKKYLKQAIELGTKSHTVYQRLGRLYWHQFYVCPSTFTLLKAEKVGLAFKKLDNTSDAAVSLLKDIYSSKFYRDDLSLKYN